VLFAVAAGPRVGFGHLLRARSLARALGVPPVVALRGTAATRRRAIDLGLRPAERGFVPDVIVVDDPVTAEVRRWVRRARAARVPVASVHDLGLSTAVSDLIVDGTVAPGRRVNGRVATVRGPAFMILDPMIPQVRARRVRPERRRIFVALGGGRTAAATTAVARAVESALADVDVRTASGFSGARRGPDGLAQELARAQVAVVSGGVTLYEACALGVPAVAVAVTPNQRITIRAMARSGAVIDASGSRRKIIAEVARLLEDPRARRELSRAGKQLVDGRGAFRVAAAIRRLARTRGADAS
jgi:spore coat polysaccharide biosynthesis predicted glycosyltransferase SpsG